MDRIKRILRPIVRLSRFLAAGSRVSPTALDLVRMDAIRDSADFIKAHSQNAMLFDDRRSLWRYVLANANAPGVFLEFGVYQGRSINFFAEVLTEKIFHGFDSFQGLHEDWTGTNMPRGTFSTRGIAPKVHNNVRLHVGWFNESLPRYLHEESSPVAFVHLDADTFEATFFVLEQLAPRLKKDSVLLFDEFHSFPLWRTSGEYAAWLHVAETFSIEYEYIAFGPAQACIRVR